MPLLIDGLRMPSLKVAFNSTNPISLKLYVDGRLLIRGGDGRQRMLRVEQWPILRGANAHPLQLTEITEEHGSFSPLVEHSRSWRIADDR